MSLISNIHTSCKNCVFSIYENITQTGCHLDYISQYKSKDVEILEAYDEEKEFYVINDKKCLGYRENKWFAQFNLEHASIEEKISKFKESNHLSYLLVIDLKDFNDDSFNKLKDNIKNYNIKPEKIIFIRYQWINNFHFNKIKHLLEESNINCKWRIQTMVDESLSNKDILHNIVNLNKSYRFIMMINKPFDNFEKILDTANNIVYNNLDFFTAIKDKEDCAVLFSAPSYRWSFVVEKKNILEDENNYITI